MHYVLCYPVFSSASTQKIEAFRQVHEPFRAGMVRAHVTIVFGINSVGSCEIRDLVASIAAKALPFSITLDHVKSWEDPISGEWKLFLQIDHGREHLMSLHNQLYKGLGRWGVRSNLSLDPHVTVATAASKVRIQAALNEAPGLDLPIFGRVEALDVATLEDDRLISVDRLKFGGHLKDMA